MEKQKNYIEHHGRAVETDRRFEHVMAIALNPRSEYRSGIIRCITKREGNIQVGGYIDRSVLHKVRGNSLEYFNIGDKLVIKNESEIIKQIGGQDWDFLGPEDPDIWIDEKMGLARVYFTIPLRHKIQNKMLIYLGHASGENFNSLEMNMPVLMDEGGVKSAKELSIAPLNKNGFRYNLIESAERGKDFWHSIVRAAIAEDMGKQWEFGDTLFNPAEHNISWTKGHASPGPLLPNTFIDIGEGKRLGILNGREANQKAGDKIKYGIFSVGLFIYDYENGKIDWVSPNFFIRDSQAKTITFASQFVETGAGLGILYAHIDDSFVRAYTINADKIKPLLP